MTALTLRPTRHPVLGLLVIIVSVLAAIFALALLVIPPAVAPTVWSYPLASVPFVVGQVFVGIHHLVLAAGLFAAWRIGLAGRSRFAAVTAVLASVTMALFAVVEVVAASAADDDGATELVGLLGGLYGGFILLVAVASILFGVAIVRARTWQGITRLTVLVTGVFLIVPMVPAQFDPLFWGRIAVATWSLLYIGLGIGLRRGSTS